MHILEQYSLNCGLKIGKPYIYDKFYPLPFERYITFNPFGKFNSRKYSYWQEVIDLIYPILEEHNIKIVQIGTAQEEPYSKCYHLMGKTNISQTAFVVKNSMLHFGVDSFAIHLASAFQKKIVALYCNMFASNSKPYWSKDKDTILLQADLNNKKPSFSAEENPKTINSIKPEVICNSILELLEIRKKIKIKSFFLGKQYGHILLESLPSFIMPQNLMPGKQLNIRFDYISDITENDYKSTIFNLQNRPCSIITDKYIDINLISSLKQNITNIFYDITLEKEVNLKFIKNIQENGIKIVVIFDKYKSDCLNNLNNKKLELIDCLEPINVIEKNNTPFHSDRINYDNVFYASKKILFANNNAFLSKRAFLENKPLKQPVDISNASQNIAEILNKQLLIEEESDFLYFFEKN